jgi:hypothetical protein
MVLWTVPAEAQSLVLKRMTLAEALPLLGGTTSRY